MRSIDIKRLEADIVADMPPEMQGIMASVQALLPATAAVELLYAAHARAATDSLGFGRTLHCINVQLAFIIVTLFADADDPLGLARSFCTDMITTAHHALSGIVMERHGGALDVAPRIIRPGDVP